VYCIRQLIELRLEYVDGSTVRPATALWENAEVPLRSQTSADVLAILDCCFASTAAVKGSSDQTRAYHLLAASSTEGYTPEPGKNSFTTALCNSLGELLDESGDEIFPLIKLWERINTKPGQGAINWDRLQRHKHTFGHIQLGRLPPNPERDASFHETEPELASLTLRFSLKTVKLNDDQIRKLAHSLPVACKEAGIPVRRMEWVRFEQRDNYLKRKVAKALMRSLSGSKRKRSSSGIRERFELPETGGQAQPGGVLLHPPTRNMREQSAASEDIVESGLCTPPRRSGRSRHTKSE
jgi:hypothetical protein